jgi:hypothetical protein
VSRENYLGINSFVDERILQAGGVPATRRAQEHTREQDAVFTGDTTFSCNQGKFSLWFIFACRRSIATHSLSDFDWIQSCEA